MRGFVVRILSRGANREKNSSAHTFSLAKTGAIKRFATIIFVPTRRTSTRRTPTSHTPTRRTATRRTATRRTPTRRVVRRHVCDG